MSDRRCVTSQTPGSGDGSTSSTSSAAAAEGGGGGQRPGANGCGSGSLEAPTTVPEEEEGGGSRSWILASTPPCLHNNWDNVRVKKSVVTLSCRDCRSSWKRLHPIDVLCPDFYQRVCPFGPHCPYLHVHRFKSRAKSPNPPGYIEGTQRDALFYQCAKEVIDRSPAGTSPTAVYEEVEELVVGRSGGARSLRREERGCGLSLALPHPNVALRFSRSGRSPLSDDSYYRQEQEEQDSPPPPLLQLPPPRRRRSGSSVAGADVPLPTALVVGHAAAWPARLGAADLSGSVASDMSGGATPVTANSPGKCAPQPPLLPTGSGATFPPPSPQSPGLHTHSPYTPVLAPRFIASPALAAAAAAAAPRVSDDDEDRSVERHTRALTSTAALSSGAPPTAATTSILLVQLRRDSKVAAASTAAAAAAADEIVRPSPSFGVVARAGAHRIRRQAGGGRGGCKPSSSLPSSHHHHHHHDPPPPPPLMESTSAPPSLGGAVAPAGGFGEELVGTEAFQPHRWGADAAAAAAPMALECCAEYAGWDASAAAATTGPLTSSGRTTRSSSQHFGPSGSFSFEQNLSSNGPITGVGSANMALSTPMTLTAAAAAAGGGGGGGGAAAAATTAAASAITNSPPPPPISLARPACPGGAAPRRFVPQQRALSEAGAPVPSQ